VTGTLLLALGTLYTPAHRVRLALARHPRPVTASTPASVTVLQPTTLGRLGEAP